MQKAVKTLLYPDVGDSSSFEMLVSIYWATWCSNREDDN
jgi:hypothetical protein